MKHGDDCERSDAGFTLIEVLLTIVILAIAITVFMTGIATAISGSSHQRQDVLAASALRAEVVALQEGAAAACPAPWPPSASSLVSLSPASPTCPTVGSPTQIVVTVKVAAGPRLPAESLTIWVRAP